MPLDVERIRAARPENVIHYLQSVTSTMHAASLLAAKGEVPGTVIVAEEQTAGLGRLGRSWISEPEVGIYCSVLLRLALPPSELPIATLLLGLATADAIQRATDLACDLRWPNDVLVGKCKVAGILAQLADTCVIAGIGINVNQSSMPDGLRTPASSLRMESGGRPQSREAVLIELLQSLDEFSDLLFENGPQAILAAFTAASSYVMSRRVMIEDSGLQGTTFGLDKNGFLLLRTPSGSTERIATGGVRALD